MEFQWKELKLHYYLFLLNPSLLNPSLPNPPLGPISNLVPQRKRRDLSVLCQTEIGHGVFRLQAWKELYRMDYLVLPVGVKRFKRFNWIAYREKWTTGRRRNGSKKLF